MKKMKKEKMRISGQSYERQVLGLMSKNVSYYKTKLNIITEFLVTPARVLKDVYENNTTPVCSKSVEEIAFIFSKEYPGYLYKVESEIAIGTRAFNAFLSGNYVVAKELFIKTNEFEESMRLELGDAAMVPTRRNIVAVKIAEMFGTERNGACSLGPLSIELGRCEEHMAALLVDRAAMLSSDANGFHNQNAINQMDADFTLYCTLVLLNVKSSVEAKKHIKRFVLEQLQCLHIPAEKIDWIINAVRYGFEFYHSEINHPASKMFFATDQRDNREYVLYKVSYNNRNTSMLDRADILFVNDEKFYPEKKTRPFSLPVLRRFDDMAFGTDLFHKIVLQMHDEAQTGLGALLEREDVSESMRVSGNDLETMLPLSPRYTPSADRTIVSSNDRIYCPEQEEVAFESSGWASPIPITPKEVLDELIGNLDARTHFGVTF